MADRDKNARLAAAKKKLRQSQKASNSPNSSKLPHISVHPNNGHVNTSESPAPIASNLTYSNAPAAIQKTTISKTNSTISSNNPATKIQNLATTTYTTSNTNHPPTIFNTDTIPKNPPQTTNPNTQNDSKYTEINQTQVIQSSTAHFNGNVEPENNIYGTADLQKANNLLTLQNEELKNKMAKLQLSLEVERRSFEERLKKDVGSLREQLHVHIETVSILVAEKTELQKTCNQVMQVAEERLGEISDLNGRLKAGRHRVSDIEREAVTLKTSNKKLEAQNKEFSKELDRLKMDAYKNNKVREEMQQHNLELQGKLQKKTHELAKSEEAMQEHKRKLEMSEVYIEQLKSGQDRPDSSVSKQIELILTEKTHLQTQLQMQDDSLKLMAREREATATQYHDYVLQLSNQNKNLQTQVESAMRERDEMGLRSGELQEDFNRLKSKQSESTTDQLQVHEEKSRLLGDVEDLMTQLMTASNEIQEQKQENEDLQGLLEEKEQERRAMEVRVARISGDMVDSDKLLDEMNNDKTALSRAVSQNIELKKQLEEFQIKFVKMTNKEIDLVNKLKSQEHRCDETGKRLGTQEEEIKLLKNSIDAKTRYLNELENAMQDLKSSSSSSTSDQDKMAELFRLKVPLIENLQTELSSAQDTVNALTNQNSELREKLFLLEQNPPAHEVTFDLDNKATSERVGRLELEKANMLEQLKEATKVQDLLKNKIDMIQNDMARQVPAMINGDVVNRVNFEALQHAMMQLEDKHSRVMRDKADMEDTIERQEHIIMQLQGESDTIGEYVSLYQQQRFLMRQKTVEKESHIEQLSSQRKQLQIKIHQLQSLVLQLLNEGGLTVEDVGAHLVGMEGVKEGGKRRKRRRMGEGVSVETAEGDWPDYSDSSEDDEIPKEPASDKMLEASPLATNIDQSHNSSPNSKIHKNIPRDNTVSKIMNLLDEISSSSSSSPSLELFKMNFFCKNCIGDILVV